jgi:hypothetical protein
MVPHYWTADVRRREGLDRHGELARYLRWEYGEWTVAGFLSDWVPERESSQHTRRLRFVEHLGRLRPAIKARSTTKTIVRLGQELRLLAQWKRGELGPSDLVNRLEELDRKAKISGSSPSQ